MSLEFILPRVLFTETSHGNDTPWRGNCVVITSANINISSITVGSIIDGVTLAANDRLLVAAQTNAIENGIYIVGSPTERAPDMPIGERVGGVSIRIEKGSDPFSLWVCTTQDAIVGTDNLIFERDYLYNSSPAGIVFGDGTNNTQTLIPFSLGAGNSYNIGFENNGIPSNIDAITLNNTSGNVGFKLNSNTVSYFQLKASNQNSFYQSIGAINWINFSANNLYALIYQNAGSAIPLFISTTGSAVTNVQLSTNTSNISLLNNNIRFNGSITFNSYGSGTQSGAANRELKVDNSGRVRENIREFFSAYNSSSQIISGNSFVILNIDTIINSTAEFKLSGGVITFGKSGNYKITYDASFNSSGLANVLTVEAVLYDESANNEVKGSRSYITDVRTTGPRCCTATVILSPSKGYSVRARIINGASANLRELSCRISIMEV